MFALLFMLLSALILLAIAGGIWIVPTPLDPNVNDSTTANDPGEAASKKPLR